MNIFRKPMLRQPKEKQKKCRIKVKRGPDGSFTKEAIGDGCTKEVVEMLSNTGEDR